MTLDRPLRTTVPWRYHHGDRLLDICWRLDDAAPAGSRICAVMPRCEHGPVPIGLVIVCLAVSIGLRAGLTLEDLIASSDGVDDALGSLSCAPVTAAETIGALARYLAVCEALDAPASAYALHSREERPDA